MLRRAIILSINETEAHLQLSPLTTCVGCERQRERGVGPGHCGIDLLGLSQGGGGATLSVPIPTSGQLNVGDDVMVHLPAASLKWLILAFKVYGLPVLGLLCGVTLGTQWNELAGASIGMLGLCAGLCLGRRSCHVPQSLVAMSSPGYAPMRIVSKAAEFRK